MRRAIAVLGFVGVLTAAAASFLLIPHNSSRAAGAKDEATFLIPASEGYGVAECLTGGGDCGRVIAQAWCEAQGYGAVTAFGPLKAEDVTGAVPVTAVDKADADRPIAITCKD
jgi:hypothetical protein